MNSDPTDPLLDDLLELDRVDVPAGLSERITRNVRAQEQPVRRPRALRLAFAGLAAAAALLVVFALRRNDAQEGRAANVPEIATLAVEPSDELLSALPTLVHLDFLIDELEPLEADAMFLLDADDRLLLELMEEDS